MATIRCPHCGSPVRIRGSRRECGYCGDFGSISSLHPSEKAKLMGGGRTHRSDPRHGDGYL